MDCRFGWLSLQGQFGLEAVTPQHSTAFALSFDHTKTEVLVSLPVKNICELYNLMDLTKLWSFWETTVAERLEDPRG